MNRLLQDGSRKGLRAVHGFCVAGLAVAASLIAAVNAHADVTGLWTSGHGDLSVVHSGSASQTSFEFEVHVKQGAVVGGTTISGSAGEHGYPNQIQINVPATANLKRINNPDGFFEGVEDGYDFTGTAYDATGAAVGGNLWMLGGSGDAAHYRTPFVGLSAEEVSGTWDPESISLTLGTVGFDGSAYGTTGGVFSYYDDITLTAKWSSVNDFEQQAVSLEPGTGHTHGLMFFSQPGTYQVTLLANGTLAGDPGIPVSGSAVYTFQVVPEPSSVALAGLGVAGVLAAGWRRRRRATGRISTATEIAG